MTTATRSSSLDAIRTILVAWIIGGHALLGYSSIGGWGYDEVAETVLHPTVELVLAAILGPSAIFLMSTFFLIAGLFTPASVDRKGSGDFARDRVLRLGLPFLVSAFVVWPACLWIAYRSSGVTVSYHFLLTGRERLIDSGGLWFVEVLLIFSLCYLVWRRWGPAPRSDIDPFTLPRMTLLAATIVVTTFLVRQVFSARGTQFLDLHLWQWPQLIGMFALGIIGARHGLVEAVPDKLGRAGGWVTLGCVLSAPPVALALGVDNLAGDAPAFLGGWGIEAMVLAIYEGVLVVFGSLFLLWFAQQRLHAVGPLWHKLRRSSFAAFILQGPVLILVAVAMRPVPVPAEVKALVVLVAGLAGCFSLGWLLVTRTRLGRII